MNITTDVEKIYASESTYNMPLISSKKCIPYIHWRVKNCAKLCQLLRRPTVPDAFTFARKCQLHVLLYMPRQDTVRMSVVMINNNESDLHSQVSNTVALFTTQVGRCDIQRRFDIIKAPRSFHYFVPNAMESFLNFRQDFV